LSLHGQIFDAEGDSLPEPRLENGAFDYPELVGDILTTVLVNISQGEEVAKKNKSRHLQICG
jgi:hypothetical protein